MFCTACAAANTPDRSRCSGCGSGLAGQPMGNQSAATRRRSSSLPKVVSALLYRLPLLLLLAFVAVAGVRYQQERAARAASYTAAETALATGDYDTALRQFARASGFRDADSRYETERALLQPHRLAYLAGVAALDARRYDDTVVALGPVVAALPDYRDAAALLTEARRRQDALLLAAVDTAERQRDWLAAEQTLTALTASRPGDTGLASRLQTLRLGHAPLALARDDGLYLVGPDGADQRLLTNVVPVTMPAWDPARSRIAFLSPAVSSDQHAADLYVITGDGNGLTRLARGVIRGTHPVWDPAGRQIAFSRFSGGIGVVDLETGAEMMLGSETGVTINPTWSPDGRMLAVIVLSSDEQGRPSSEVRLVDVALGTGWALPGGPLPDAAALTWNPFDNRLLVYRARLDAAPGSQSTGIVIVDLDTGEREPVARGSRLVLPPVWSPDGTRIAYVEGNATIRIRRPGTLGEAVITVAHPLAGDLLWAPGGAALLALAAQPDRPSFLIPLNTGTGEGPGSAVPIELGDLVSDSDHGPPVWSGTHLPGAVAPPVMKETR